ncbi:hypothetical protein P8452_64601 [Trifolium repens]|nr:hypothetical protein P8452_64601 [Trifolium repens]
MGSSSPSPFSAILSFANPSSMPRLQASPFSVLNTRAMSKDLYFNHDGSTTKKLLVWVDLVAELLGVTLGPKGKNVVLHNKYGPTKIVNDGETVLKEVIAAGNEKGCVVFCVLCVLFKFKSNTAMTLLAITLLV